MGNSRKKVAKQSKTSKPNKAIIKELIAETSRKLGCKATTTPKMVSTAAVAKKSRKTKKAPAIRSHKKAKKGPHSEEDGTPSPSIAKEQTSSNNVIFPQITASNWNKFENTLSEKVIDEVTKKLDACIARMHGYEVYDTHFTSLHFVRLAIVDCLLHRKWDNLLRLVVMLSRNYSDPVFTMFIRHLCQILKRYHPAIRGTEYEEQIDLIVEKYDRQREKRTNTNSNI